MSTKIVIFSYPKLLSFSVLTFIKWRLTPSYAAKDTIFWQKKTQNYRYQNYCPGWQYSNLFKRSYVNTSWACALFRNNKQHVVLGQKRKCQRVEESGLWRIQRERWIEVKFFQMEQMQDICRGSVGPLERTQGSTTHPNSRWICKYFVWYVSRTCFFLLFSIVFHILWINDNAYDHFR